MGKSSGGIRNSKHTKERVKIEIQAENINEITEDMLVKVFGWTSAESKKFLKLSDEEKIIYDIKKLSERDDFTGKVAKTIIEGNYKKISAKQSDILYSKGLFKYLPMFSAYDHYIMEKREKEAKYRQAGSSLRR